MVYEEPEEVIHDIVMPAWWTYDAETGEFINKRSGVVVSRKCFLSISGLVVEYALDPHSMICGDSTVQAGRLMICTDSFEHVQHPGTLGHRDRIGYTWI